MSEERTGAEVNMDEYMKVADYTLATDRTVVKTANFANTAQGCNNAFQLGGKDAVHYAAKDDMTALQNTMNATFGAVNTTLVGLSDGVKEAKDKANNAQTSATAAQTTATDAAVKAAEAKCTASSAIPKTDIEQEPGGSEAKVMSQKAVMEAINRKVATVNGQSPDLDGNVEVCTPAIITGYSVMGNDSMPLMDGTQWYPINSTLESTIGGDYCKGSAIYVPPGYSKVFVMASCGAQESGNYTFECRLYSSKNGGNDEPIALNTISTSGGNSACTVQWAGKTQGIEWIGVKAKCIVGTTPRYYNLPNVSHMTCIFFN